MRKTFVSVVGQQDNLGDSALRRGLLDVLRGVSDLQVFVGNSTDSYISGLKLQAGDKVYRNRFVWFANAIFRGLISRGNYAFNPGEVRISRESRYIGVLTRATLGAVRIGKGGIIHTGVGVRAPSGAIPAAERRALERCDLITWRDADSQAFAGIGTVAPDWAFALQGRSGGETKRRLLAVTLRGDRPMPHDAWFDEVRRLAQLVSADPIVVVQVERDTAMSQAIAAKLGCEVAPWSAEHKEQEERVREIYAASIATVSDRLHALVIAYTEGAAPLGYTPNSVEKLRRTLAPVGISVDAENLAELYSTVSAELDASRQLSRTQIASATESIRRILA